MGIATANLYTHLLPEADREAAGAMQALLGSEAIVAVATRLWLPESYSRRCCLLCEESRALCRDFQVGPAGLEPATGRL